MFRYIISEIFGFRLFPKDARISNNRIYRNGIRSFRLFKVRQVFSSTQLLDT